MAVRTLEIEARALSKLAANPGDAFAQAVQRVLACSGRVVVMGMGKSGHVGRKIAATLASTGTPAMFVHPAEASHGDLGMVLPGDLVLAISNSGESDELAAILPALLRLDVQIIAITGGAESTLARHAHTVMSSAVDEEACPLNLAPTASTTAQMALGDALAVALLDARGFKAEDFARSHPGGSLGRKLLIHVHDLMRSGDAVPRVGPAATFALREAIYALEGVAREMVDWNPNEGVRAALEAAMCANPAHWTSHYSGDERQRAYLRHFSYSDRSRYYWTDPAVSQQVDRLFERLDAQPLPLPLISQYLPQHAQAVGDGRVPATALGLCIANIQLALTPYADACGAQRSTVSES